MSLDRRALLTASLGVAAALATACSPARTPGAAPGSTGTAGAAGPAPGGPRAPTTRAPVRTASAQRPAAPASSAAVAARATVPVLCWHQLRDWRRGDGAYARRVLICPPRQFRAQLDALVAGGWTTISPDQYLAHLTTGAVLPPRPVLLSFDDSQGTQITQGLPQLLRRELTATFFCMTVVLGKRDWMSTDDLRRLRDAGMTVAAHSYDHARADRYSGKDWSVQLEKPRELLERALRQPVDHFAYPYGAWAPADFPHLRAAGYRTAFQLADSRIARAAPLYTLRRTLVGSTWTGAQLVRQLGRAA